MIPKISIAMTTYNGEKFLKKQLDSLLHQTIIPYEIIICDDHSSDKTPDILNAYTNRYASIKLYHNKNSLELVKNFEKAISLCTGDYIALCDQDDIWIETKLQEQVKAIQSLEKKHPNSPLMVHSDLKMIDEKETLIHHSYFKFRNYTLTNKKDLAYILGPCSIMGNTMLFNQKLKGLILPFLPYTKVHDYMIALINETYGERVTIETPLVFYRIHHNNTSNTKKQLTKSKKFLGNKINLPYHNINREKLLKAFILRFDLNKKDKQMIQAFIKYLEFHSTTPKLIYILLRYNFLKKGFWFKMKIFAKIYLKKNVF